MIATLTRQMSVVAALALLTAGTVRADTWNERTILTFSDPVMIPGETLEPGKYIFRLLDSTSSRNVVQVLRADDGNEPVATAMAVPLKRAETRGDIVLRFNPTEAGHPPAIKAWFYPGSTFGHQFVYPDEQARVIAQRTKTVVLAIDQPGTDLEKGTLHLYDASGTQTEWNADEQTTREWEAWRQTRERQGNGRVEDQASGGESAQERRAGTASAYQTDREGLRVAFDDLEEHPSRYIGKTVSVDAEVERVLGPRMFTIDEPNWGDLDGEVLVHMPSSLVALVREDDRVTITGEVERVVTADLEREWGWMGLDPGLEGDFSAKPIIKASRIVGGDSNVALLIEAGKAVPRVAGERAGADRVLIEVNDVAAGDEELVGQRVTLQGARVDEMSAHGGFFVESESDSLFVLPADGADSDVSPGQTVTVEGVILEAPDNLALEGDLPQDTNEDIYVLATEIVR